MVGTPAMLCVNVLGLNGKIVRWRALDVVGSGSVGDSVYGQRTVYSAMRRRRQD